MNNETGTGNVDNNSQRSPLGDKAKASAPFFLLAAGVFIICSIVQSTGDSSMFSTSFADTGSSLHNLLMQLTFWPGWIAIIVFVVGGVSRLNSDD